MDVSVAVGTFGDQGWATLAETRAIPSVPEGIPVIHRHGETLAKARNEALALVKTEWVVHLDADDELGEGYLEAMAAGTADLRAPAVRHLRYGQEYGPTRVPQVWGHEHDCVGECLRWGNWLCIGTCVRTDLARRFGWEEFGWSEDYALFARCWKAGATTEGIPEAVYVAHHDERGRNRVSRDVGVYWHKQIEAAVWPEEPSVL